MQVAPRGRDLSWGAAMAGTVKLLDFVKSLTPLQKQATHLTIDMALVPLALALTLALETDGANLRLLTDGGADFWALTGSLMLSAAIFSTLLGLPRIKLNAYEQQAILRTSLFAGLVGMAGGPTLLALPGAPLPASALIDFTLVLTVLAVVVRLFMRSILIAVYRRGGSRTRVLIYGAGQTGVQLAAALRTDDTLDPVAFVDDNPTLQKRMVAGLRVHAPIRIEKLIDDRAIDRVVLAMPSISKPKQIRLARKLEGLGCDVRTLPSFASMVAQRMDLLERIQPLDPDFYLGRPGFETELSAIRDTYLGRVVMVTGAGGSIGSELCRQLLACRPRRLVLFEVSEFALFQLERELADLVQGKATEIVAALGSVTDACAVRRTLTEEGVEIVLHAAAYKHVPMVERGMLSGLRNNVIGTRILADAAREAGVSRFILISTDKAVRPSSAMGASKRLAELIVQDRATRAEKTRFSMVRFGNVLGSSGSVVPLFEEQIARGGPVTLTHLEVTRYFMTIGEAARLVLLAGTYSTGGEVFVLDMGQPVAIRDLAKQMIESAGYSLRDADNPDGDIEIAVVGLRPGEKLHEELVIGTDLRGTAHPKILRAVETHLSEVEMATALKALDRAIEAGDRQAAVEVIRRWVDGYAPSLAAEADKATS